MASRPWTLPALTQASARRGLLVTAVVLAVVLVAASLSSWRAASRATQAVAHAQADTYLRALGSLHAQRNGPPSEEELRTVLQAFEADGLLWLGLVAPDGQVMAEAGSRDTTPLDVDPAGRALITLTDRVRIVAPRGRPGPGPLGPPPGFGPGPEGRRVATGGPPPPPGVDPLAGPPPALILEFRPSAASALVTNAARTFAISTAVALALVGAALVFWRVALRAQRTDEALAAQKHLATLGEMSAVLAHEIRNPLAALKGHAQLLLETLPDEGPARAKAGRVLGAAERLERLVQDLLGFARSGQITRTDVDPVELVRGVVDEIDPGVPVDVDRAPGTWPLDRRRIRQVIVNLVGNARESCPDGDVRCLVSQRGAMLWIEVSDRGPGVPADLREQIFEPFQTGKTRGVGLGLAVARRICALHGGSLVVADRPGGGAVFRAELPRT